jgi:hypothetical protein
VNQHTIKIELVVRMRTAIAKSASWAFLAGDANQQPCSLESPGSAKIVTNPHHFAVFSDLI